MEVYKTNGPHSCSGKEPVLILAHGAGAPADSSFMEMLAESLADEGVTTVRFEFSYMAKRREDGRKRPPERQPALLAQLEQLIAEIIEGSLAGRPLFIGGKSMGGRMASLLAADPRLKGRFRGVLCFGYPFHPPGKDRWRTDHFPDFWCPVLIIQGTRDPFGKPDEVNERLATLAEPELVWLEGGNHDFQPLARQPETQIGLIQQAARSAAAFMRCETGH
ncbi:alpha/beta family hydrolase [Marinobacter sp. DUT-3]|uniref:alpha/beta family hydrolase n=1 Tax=Marinobacter sp. DUT-3 TaxID=3412036 RepID=UPI003D182B7B